MRRRVKMERDKKFNKLVHKEAKEFRNAKIDETFKEVPINSFKLFIINRWAEVFKENL